LDALAAVIPGFAEAVAWPRSKRCIPSDFKVQADAEGVADG